MYFLITEALRKSSTEIKINGSNVDSFYIAAIDWAYTLTKLSASRVVVSTPFSVARVSSSNRIVLPSNERVPKLRFSERLMKSVPSSKSTITSSPLPIARTKMSLPRPPDD